MCACGANVQSNTLSAMSASGEPVTPVAYGAPVGGGWIYLQPTQIGLSPTKFDHYLHKQSLGLGVAQIVIGSLCIVFNAVILILGSDYYFLGLGFVGHGFWCGVLFIVTGALGISAGVSKTKCKIVSYMVLCIISACFTTGLLSCGIIGALLSGSDLGYCNGYGYSMSYRYYYRPPCSTALTAVVMEGCMAVCAFIAAILFIWGSLLGCKAKPCCYNRNLVQQVLLPSNYSFNNGLQMIQSSQNVLPTMPYQPGVPPAYQPSLAPALWTQPQQMQETAAAAADDPYPTPNPTQAFGKSSVQQHSQPQPKY